jgi:uncharacterized LabA/DUF88 family protein
VSALRTVIFIDGENFRNNLRNFSYQSTPPHPTNPYFQLEERHFHWKQFFDGIIKEFNDATGWEHQLLRVYWYYSATISPWYENSMAAQQIVNRYPDKSLNINQVNQLAKQWYERERDYFEKLREKVFEDIQRKTDFLEFKYVGQYIIRPYQIYKIEFDTLGRVTTYLGYQQGEKGVDVGIAVDMISKMPNYDVAILVSGDADYIPAVRYLKDNLKYVYQFSLAKGVPPSIEYLSPYLKGIVDCFAYYDELRLLSEFLDRTCYPAIPPPIMQAIDAKITSLTTTTTP